jgi:hypothetical protein
MSGGSPNENRQQFDAGNGGLYHERSHRLHSAEQTKNQNFDHYNPLNRTRADVIYDWEAWR